MKTSKELSEMIGVAIGRLALCAGEIPDGEKRQKYRELAESSIKILGDELHRLQGVASATLEHNQQLANQRDWVWCKLDSTIDQMNQAIQVSDDLRGLLHGRGNRLSRMAEALTAAEKDLADLRWLVRWARQGATAPVCESVNPPPSVGGANATAQAEGGEK